MEKVSFSECRDLLLKSIVVPKKSQLLPPLYMQGGTAVGGLAPIKQAPAPYLPKGLPVDRTHTLVLDLDETLVHYIEVPGTEGKYLVRPGCLEFL